MAYRMNGIPQIGGDGDAKKKLNTPYDSLKAGVGRMSKSHYEFGGSFISQDKPIKLDEAKAKIKADKDEQKPGQAYQLDSSSRMWYPDSDFGHNGPSVAEITMDDKDGFYWYGKHHSYPKKKKPTPKMDKIPTKGISKGKKVEAKIKNAPKPKVKYNLYSSASQLAKQNKAVGYTETKLPGASKVLRRNMSANEYKNK